MRKYLHELLHSTSEDTLNVSSFRTVLTTDISFQPSRKKYKSCCH